MITLSDSVDYNLRLHEDETVYRCHIFLNFTDCVLKDCGSKEHNDRGEMIISKI